MAENDKKFTQFSITFQQSVVHHTSKQEHPSKPKGQWAKRLESRARSVEPTQVILPKDHHM